MNHQLPLSPFTHWVISHASALLVLSPSSLLGTEISSFPHAGLHLAQIFYLPNKIQLIISSPGNVRTHPRMLLLSWSHFPMIWRHSFQSLQRKKLGFFFFWSTHRTLHYYSQSSLSHFQPPNVGAFLHQAVLQHQLSVLRISCSVVSDLFVTPRTVAC